MKVLQIQHTKNPAFLSINELLFHLEQNPKPERIIGKVYKMEIITYLGKDIYKLNDFINSPEFINSVTGGIELRCDFGEIHVPKRVDLYTSAIKHPIYFNFCNSVFTGKGISIHTTTQNNTTFGNLTGKVQHFLESNLLNPIKLN